MSVLFLSDRDDPIMRGAYEYLAQRYPCYYIVDGTPNTFNPDIIITNHFINPTGKKMVYYVTSNTISTDIAQRRMMLGWFKNCDVICSSWAIAKMFYDTFRVKPSVQHPCVIEQDTNQISIYYSNNFNDMKAIRNELPYEEFIQIEDPYDVVYAKVYLASSPLLLDLALCVASSCGVPVVSENSPYLKEFLDDGDVVLGPNTPLNLKIQTIKKVLKECSKLKTRSNRFNQAPALEDKIRQALARKPTTMPLPKVDNKMSGVKRHRPTPEIPKPLHISSDTIYVTGNIVGFSGYDLLVKEVIHGLKSINVDVRINSYSNMNYDICPDYFKAIHCSRSMDAWEIVIIPPCSLDKQGQPISKKSIVFTMWETDHLEPHWAKQINQSAFAIVPSQWAIDTFKESGVRVPIYKAPLGYDPVMFNADDDYPTECVFGTAAALTAGGLRKNTSQVVSLFQRAFPNDEKVKLKVKIMPHCPWKENHDPRIEVTKALLSTEELAHWYKSLSALINCSYAEGFGLHLIEAMACGRPVISTAYSAVTEYFDEDVGYVVDHEIIKASGEGRVPYTGHLAKPVEESMIEQMRHVYENREEAQMKGYNAAIRAKAFTWKDMGLNLVKILKANGVMT